MSMSDGPLYDTYAAALQHDLVEFPESAIYIGVVRRPMPWFTPYVDENRQALGPPRTLLEEFQATRQGFIDEGMADADAHNEAWHTIDYPDRYRAYLAQSHQAQTALSDIEQLLETQSAVVLVCYENTDDKRCHRTILRDELAFDKTSQ